MQKILIIQTASIGDVILATALAESLHREWPEAEIDILVKKGCETLFTGHPFIRTVYAWDKKHSKLLNFFRLLKRVRNRRYDLTVNVQRFFLTGLLTVLSGSRQTRGFAKNPLSLFFSKRFPHPIGNGIHETERNHTLIADLVRGPSGRPGLYPTEEDRRRLIPGMPGIYVTISPASLWFTKQFPEDRWMSLMRALPAHLSVLLLGGPDDAGLCDRIITGAGREGSVNLAGRLTLLQSAALMKGAVMNYTNDSAPMHLASAVNAPVTAIFCSTVPGFGFGPLSDDSLSAECPEPLPCRPCGLHGHRSCPESHFRCALDIPISLLAARAR